MKLPEEWLYGKKVLTADQVKKLPVGTTICFHQCYGKSGEHIWVNCKIVQSGNRKKLSMRDYRGMQVLKDIVTKENIAYTEVER
ncbi:MAG: hypothetical protein IJL91_06860 [Bacteroidales bacterium]|nr:hypothetical protein [Bacteroidales bacterium]